jgi:hypothetical protein
MEAARSAVAVAQSSSPAALAAAMANATASLANATGFSASEFGVEVDAASVRVVVLTYSYDSWGLVLDFLLRNIGSVVGGALALMALVGALFVWEPLSRRCQAHRRLLRAEERARFKVRALQDLRLRLMRARVRGKLRDLVRAMRLTQGSVADVEGQKLQLLRQLLRTPGSTAGEASSEEPNTPPRAALEPGALQLGSGGSEGIGGTPPTPSHTPSIGASRGSARTEGHDSHLPSAAQQLPLFAAALPSVPAAAPAEGKAAAPAPPALVAAIAEEEMEEEEEAPLPLPPTSLPPATFRSSRLTLLSLQSSRSTVRGDGSSPGVAEDDAGSLLTGDSPLVAPAVPSPHATPLPPLPGVSEATPLEQQQLEGAACSRRPSSTSSSPTSSNASHSAERSPPGTAERAETELGARQRLAERCVSPEDKANPEAP